MRVAGPFLAHSRCTRIYPAWLEGGGAAAATSPERVSNTERRLRAKNETATRTKTAHEVAGRPVGPPPTTAATIAGHLDAYRWALAQYFAAGMGNTQIGGKALYWDDASREAVVRWTGFYRRHRQTLIQPLIHLRRANGQGWDGWLHANSRVLFNSSADPLPTEVGAAIIFNPTELQMVETIAFPLYYTGLTGAVLVSVDEAAPVMMTIARDYYLLLELTITPRNLTTVVFSHPGST